MEPQSFDRFARLLASRGSRRALGMFAVSAAGAVALAVHPNQSGAQGTCSLACPGEPLANDDLQLIVNTPPDICSAVVTFDEPAMSGDCGKVAVNCDHDSGAIYEYGYTDVTCVTSDQSATCSFTVIVVDATDRDITCPADVTVESTEPIAVTFDDPVPQIVCPHDWFCSYESGDVFDVGTTQVICQLSGMADGPTVCQFFVTVAGPVATSTIDPTATDPVSTEVPATEIPATDVPLTPTPAPVATSPVTALPETGSGTSSAGKSWILPTALVGAGAATLTRLGLRQRAAARDKAHPT